MERLTRVKFCLANTLVAMQVSTFHWQHEGNMTFEGCHLKRVEIDGIEQNLVVSALCQQEGGIT